MVTRNFSPLIQLVQSFKSREMKPEVKREDRLAVHVLRRTKRLVISRVKLCSDGIVNDRKAWKLLYSLNLPVFFTLPFAVAATVS